MKNSLLEDILNEYKLVAIKETNTRLELHIRHDNNIHVGDLVQCFDGSGMTTIDGQKVYVVDKIDEVEIYNLPAKVIATNQYNKSDIVYLWNKEYQYLQDIIIEVKGRQFRTCSKFVRKISQE